MESMRAELARRIEQERSEYDRLMNSIEQLYKQGALAAERDRRWSSWKVQRTWSRQDQTASVCRRCCKTLEEKEKVAQLLGAVSRRKAGGGAGGDRAR
jgi:heat-inducible transcriptional repressor